MKYLLIVLVVLLILPSCSTLVAGADWICQRVDDSGTFFTTVGTKAGQFLDLCLSTVCGVFKSAKGDFSGAWSGIEESFKNLAEMGGNDAVPQPTSRPGH